MREKKEIIFFILSVTLDQVSNAIEIITMALDFSESGLKSIVKVEPERFEDENGNQRINIISKFTVTSAVFLHF